MVPKSRTVKEDGPTYTVQKKTSQLKGYLYDSGIGIHIESAGVGVQT
jgi:hypothetical protein